MPIPSSFLDELVSRTDIAELVGDYVRLTKRSGSNLFGLCPFHSEKTPSFSVNSDKQIYHCFGCGKGGGSINFVMEMENLEFRDAVEFIARRAGMTVPESGDNNETAGKRKRMLQLNRDAAIFFHKTLTSPLGGNARGYLAKRGISGTMVTRFGIGTAPESWTLLLDAMTAKGYSKQELIDSGLARKSKKAGEAYDYFRDRLMFPIINVRGDVIGFSGRILGDGEPKYLNSPDTIVFKKSANLFGLNIAKKTKAGMLILAEGNTDVIALHQAGFDCAVASLGTSLTAEQARLMSRYADKIVVAFDSDEAGHKAALRAISLLEKTGAKVKVLSMTGAKDPDEFLKKHGSAAFDRLINLSEGHIEYRLMMIKNNAELTTDEGRIAYINTATDLLTKLDSSPEREIYSSVVADVSGVSKESISAEVAKKLKRKGTKQKKDFEKAVTRPKTAILPADKSLRYQNEYSAAAEEELIRCFMLDTSLIKTAQSLDFSSNEFTSPFLRKIYDELLRRITNEEDTATALIMSALETSEAARLTVILQKPDTLPCSEKPIRDCILKIRNEQLKLADPNEDLLLEIRRRKAAATERNDH